MRDIYYKFHVTKITRFECELPIDSEAVAKKKIQRYDCRPIGWPVGEATIVEVAFEGLSTLEDIRMTRTWYRKINDYQENYERLRDLRNACKVQSDVWEAYGDSGLQRFRLELAEEFVAWVIADDEQAARKMVTAENNSDVVWVMKHRSIHSLNTFAPWRGDDKSASKTKRRRPPRKNKANSAIAQETKTTAKQDQTLEELLIPTIDEAIEEQFAVIDSTIEVLQNTTDIFEKDRRMIYRIAIMSALGLRDSLMSFRNQNFSPNGNIINHQGLSKRLYETEQRLALLRQLKVW